MSPFRGRRSCRKGLAHCFAVLLIHGHPPSLPAKSLLGLESIVTHDARVTVGDTRPNAPPIQATTERAGTETLASRSTHWMRASRTEQVAYNIAPPHLLITPGHPQAHRPSRAQMATFRQLVDELITPARLRGDARKWPSPRPHPDPVCPTVGLKLSEPRPIVVPVLRAGTGVTEGMTHCCPPPRSASWACVAT